MNPYRNPFGSEAVISHSDDDGEEAIIYTGEDIMLSHAEDEDDETKSETVADVFNTLTEKQKTVVYALIGQALEDGGKTDEDDKSVEHADNDQSNDETVADVFNALSDKDDEDGKSVEHSDKNKEEDEMATQNEKTVAEVFV